MMIRSFFLCCLTALSIQFSWSQDRLKARDLYESAEKAYLSGNYSFALDQYSRCLSADASYYDAYTSRAAVKERLGDWIGAVTDYSIYLEKFPTQSEVLFSRGLARYHSEQYRAAIADFKAFLQQPGDGETQTIFYRQSPNGGGTDQIVTAQGSISDYVWNFMGLAEYKLGNFDSAIGCFDSAVALNSREPDYYVHRGLAREGKGHLAAAEADYRKALEMDPDHGLAFHNLGVILRGKNDPAAAEEQYNLAVERNPDLSYPYLERGYHRMEKGDYYGALADYNKAIELVDDEPDSWVNRGLVKEKLQDYRGAVQDFSRAIKIRDNYEKAWFCRANVLFKMNRLQEAIDDYSVAILYAPNYGLAYLNRAIVNHRMGNGEAACRDVQKAARLGISGTERLTAKTCQ